MKTLGRIAVAAGNLAVPVIVLGIIVLLLSPLGAAVSIQRLLGLIGIAWFFWALFDYFKERDREMQRLRERVARLEQGHRPFDYD